MKEFKIAIRLREIGEDFQPTLEREIYLRNSETTVKEFEYNDKKFEFYCEKLEFGNGETFYLTHEKSELIDVELINLIKSVTDFVPYSYSISTIQRNDNWHEGYFCHSEEKEFTNYSIISNISKGGIKISASCQAQFSNTSCFLSRLCSNNS